MIIQHPIPPVYNKDSRILILGSFPSVRSREYGFFYGHPQNRFWRVIASVRGVPVPDTVEEKKALLLSQKIALWDVVASCEISGSADSSIRGVVPNDLTGLLSQTGIRTVFTNGKTADRLFDRYFTDLPVLKYNLPSTSPANARFSQERLIQEWEIMNQYL